MTLRGAGRVQVIMPRKMNFQELILINVLFYWKLLPSSFFKGVRSETPRSSFNAGGDICLLEHLRFFILLSASSTPSTRPVLNCAPSMLIALSASETLEWHDGNGRPKTDAL